jgi:hypothetical protein
MRNRCKPSPYDPQYTFSVVVTELAEGTDAEHLGELIGFFGIPIAGLILVIVGLVRRSHSTRQPTFYSPVGPSPDPQPYGYRPPSSPVAGYPNFPGSPPYPPPYPVPYPAPRRGGSSGTALIVTGSILLAFSVLGFIGRLAEVSSESQRSAHVGQCLSQTDFQHNDLTAVPRDCAEPDSIFEVAAKGDGSADCPDGKLDGSKYAFLRKGTTTLCLMLNLMQDQCYTATGTADNPSFAPATCAGAGPRVKVVKRDDDSSDVARCPTGSHAFSYPHPTRLYCLERLKN